MKFINIRAFIISLSVGLFLIYVITPPPKVIYVYPTPDNVSELQYKDDGDLCYKFDALEAKCPTDTSKIRSYPIQGVFNDK